MRDELSNLEDQLLVMDAQDGSSKAMTELVSRWNRRMWVHAYRLTSDSGGAWDVTQQSWVGIIKGIRKLNDPASFRGWVYRIVTNKSMDWLKRNISDKAVSIDDVKEPAGVESKSYGVADLLLKLDVKKRAVIYLRYFEDLSLVDIAIALQIPVGTVKSRLYSAKMEFKQIWQNDANNY
ncbi:MAG: RNA polymerase sigma factor [Anaerohalosphaera sp.]|nr:RNA polymerase sigma factor [Anaerohalosphaera sp.]